MAYKPDPDYLMLWRDVPLQERISEAERQEALRWRVWSAKEAQTVSDSYNGLTCPGAVRRGDMRGRYHPCTVRPRRGRLCYWHQHLQARLEELDELDRHPAAGIIPH